MEAFAPATPAAPPAHRRASAGPRGRALTPLHSDDLSKFAKLLRSELATHLAREPGVPSHVQLLNMLARAAGHRNVQALKARCPKGATPMAGGLPAAASAVAYTSPAGHSSPAGQEVPSAGPPGTSGATVPALGPTAQKALGQFDAWGRLQRWPTRFAVQRLAMWGLWLRFDGARTYTEREVNEILKAWVTYGDHVTPRRELVEMGLLGRKPDCSSYWKEPRRPEDEVRALLQALRQRRP